MSASDVIAFANPSYGSTDHAYAYEHDSTGHWQVCTICGYETTVLRHRIGSTYGYNGVEHWNNCTVCGMEMLRSVHVGVLNANGSYYCKICGCEDIADEMLSSDHTFELTAIRAKE